MKYLKLKNRIKELERLHSDLFWSKFELGKENERLKEQIKRLGKLNKDLVKEKAILSFELDKKQKEPIKFNISMDKKDVDDIVKKVTENVLGKQEHKCTKECFEEHILSVIQSDYNKLNFENGKAKQHFLDYWSTDLKREYDFIAYFYIVCDKIRVTYK